MREFNVKTDEAFFKKIAATRDDVQRIQWMFQSDGTIVGEDDVNNWSKSVNNLIDKLDGIRVEGHSRFELRGE